MDKDFLSGSFFCIAETAFYYKSARTWTAGIHLLIEHICICLRLNIEEREIPLFKMSRKIDI